MSQVKVYAGIETTKKWERICSRFTSNTAAFAVLVENFYNQMEAGMDITVRLTSDQVWGNVDPEDDGWNKAESEASLCEMIHGYILEEYPAAQISVEMADIERITVDGETESVSAIAQHVNALVDKAWNGDWMVAG